MAATKIASLVIKTLSKPIAASIKQQAHQHERFRQICIALAQYMHRTEMTLRLNLSAVPAAAAKKSQDSKHKDKDAKEEGTSEKGQESDSDKGGSKDDAGGTSSSSSRERHPEKAHTPRWRVFSAFTAPRAIRPLNDAKALEKGAQAFSELFLFAVAAALIIAENYRGSRKRKKQRDATEEKVDTLAEAVRALADLLEQRGLAPPPAAALSARELPSAEALEDGAAQAAPVEEPPLPLWQYIEQEAARRRADADAGEGEDSAPSGDDAPRIPESGQAALPLAPSARGADVEVEQLRAAVALLLRMAIRSGQIAGEEALRLDELLDGAPAATRRAEPNAAPSPSATGSGAPPSAQGQPQAPQHGDAQSRSEILEAVALARARALAREVRYGQGGADAGSGGGAATPVQQAESLSLAELMLRAGLVPAGEGDAP